MDEILGMFWKYDEMSRRLSTTVLDLLQKEKQARMKNASGALGGAARSLFLKDGDVDSP